MAIDEINAKGGVLGKQLEPVIVDPASNWPLFAEKTKQLPVGRRVDDHGFELLAQHAALGIDLVDRHQHRILQDGFGNGHGARQAVQDADLDGVLGLRKRVAGQAQTQGDRCGQ